MSDVRRPTAVVTGASSGIGEATCKRLLNDGWRVCLIARSLDKMKRIVSDYDQKYWKIIKCDITVANDVIEACENINIWCNNNLNLLVNNAGAIKRVDKPTETLETATVDDWNWSMNVNLRSHFLFTKCLANSLKNASKLPCKYEKLEYDGNVINVTSIAAVNCEFYQIMPYSVAKAALNQLTKSCAMELSKYKVRVNALQIGAVETPMLERLSGENSEKEIKQALDSFAELCMIGRNAQSEDIVAVIVFLSSKSNAGWITGAALPIDGGFIAQGAMCSVGSSKSNSKL